MKITEFQHNVIIRSLLGDLHIQKTKANTNKSRLRFCHSLQQKQYVDWKYTVFQSDFCKKTKAPYKTKRIFPFSYQGEYIFYTKYSHEFSLYHNTWYNAIYLKNNVSTNGKSTSMYKYVKIIPNNITKLLVDPIALAVWYLDDGSKRMDCDACRFATQSFSEKENEMLRYCLQTNFNLHSKIDKWWNKKSQKFTYGLSIPSKNSSYKKFKNLIYNFVQAEIPSMLYKLQ